MSGTWRAQSRTVSWQMSIPRSNSRSSTFRSDSGNRMYSITTSRMTSGDEFKQPNGLGGLALDLRVIQASYHQLSHPATLL